MTARCAMHNTAPVAQRIEHLTTDQKVRGSNPFGRASQAKDLVGGNSDQVFRVSHQGAGFTRGFDRGDRTCPPALAEPVRCSAAVCRRTPAGEVT